MPRSVLLTTLALTAVAAVLGFVAGRNWQPLDETQVIGGVALHHARETGGAPEDCVAVPGRGAVWLRVICGAHVYNVNRRGHLMPPRGPEA